METPKIILRTITQCLLKVRIVHEIPRHVVTLLVNKSCDNVLLQGY